LPRIFYLQVVSYKTEYILSTNSSIMVSGWSEEERLQLYMSSFMSFRE